MSQIFDTDQVAEITVEADFVASQIKEVWFHFHLETRKILRDANQNVHKKKN